LGNLEHRVSLRIVHRACPTYLQSCEGIDNSGLKEEAEVSVLSAGMKEMAMAVDYGMDTEGRNRLALDVLSHRGILQDHIVPFLCYFSQWDKDLSTSSR